MSRTSYIRSTINGARTTATGSRTRCISLGGNVAEMCLKRDKKGKRQVLYMYGKKNKNKNKNYYRKSVKVSLWLTSVGMQQ